MVFFWMKGCLCLVQYKSKGEICILMWVGGLGWILDKDVKNCEMVGKYEQIQLIYVDISFGEI